MNRLWRVGKGGRVYRSPKYMEWRKAALWDAAIQAKKFAGKIAGNYSLQVLVNRPDKRKRDLDNIIKALSDILVAAHIIADDHLCVQINMAWSGTGKMCHVIIQGVEDGQTE
jgi:crossover junction endodeoxyribonuclease RusA